MKYTRYDLKRKKRTSNYFVLGLLGVLISSLVVGTIISKLFLKNINSTINISNANYNLNNVQAGEKVNYNYIQCGVFSKKENAQELMDRLGKIGNPFEIEDGSKIKVFFGIYNKDDDIKTQIKLLQDNKIDQDSNVFTIDKQNSCDEQIVDVINADLEVLNKLNDNSVKAIETDKLKEWVNKLKKVDDGYKNSLVLKELKDYINKLPAQATKDNMKENKSFIYKELKKYKK